MIVCVCHQVSDREIARQARAGADFSDLQLELGVATQCGRCEGCARDVMRACQGGLPGSQAADPAPGFPSLAFPAWSPA